MQNPVEFALQKVLNKINVKVLNVAFPTSYDGRSVSVIEQVRLKVINNIVLPDINLGSGKTKQIVLKMAYHEPTEYGPTERYVHTGRYSLYRIPADEREGLMISSVSSIRPPFQYYNNVPENYMGVNPRINAQTLAQAIVDTHSMQGVVTVPTPELLTGDLIRLNPSQHNHLDYILTCKLEYNENMTNLNPDAIEALGKLVVAATKAYIYTTCITELDRLTLSFGTEQSTIRTIIEGYSDQEEKYEELKEEFRGAAALDIKTFRNLVSYMIPGL